MKCHFIKLFESSLNSIEYHRLLYEWSGKELPFLLLAILALLDGSINLFLQVNFPQFSNKI
jgi:hypothetical protein